MLQLTYISTAATTVCERDVEAILDVSRRNNRARGLTGMLLFDGKRFLQHLEGDESVVRATYETIKLDPRHCAIVKLSSRTADTRAFGDWDMAFERATWAGRALPTLEEQVAALVANVEPGVAAHFTGFATMRRARAA